MPACPSARFLPMGDCEERKQVEILKIQERIPANGPVVEPCSLASVHNHHIASPPPAGVPQEPSLLLLKDEPAHVAQRPRSVRPVPPLGRVPRAARVASHDGVAQALLGSVSVQQSRVAAYLSAALVRLPGLRRLRLGRAPLLLHRGGEGGARYDNGAVGV